MTAITMRAAINDRSISAAPKIAAAPISSGSISQGRVMDDCFDSVCLDLHRWRGVAPPCASGAPLESRNAVTGG